MGRRVKTSLKAPATEARREATFCLFLNHVYSDFFISSTNSFPFFGCPHKRANSKSRLLLVLSAAMFHIATLTRPDQGGLLELLVGKRNNASQLILSSLQLGILLEMNFELRIQANGSWVFEANFGHSTIDYSP